MIEIEITKPMIEKAKQNADELKVLTHSLKGKESNFVGFLGEECFVQHYKNKKLCFFSRVNDYDYDFLFYGKRVDVKTKDRTVAPLPNFGCDIPNHQRHQVVDFYFFVSLLRVGETFTKGFLLGYISKAQFFERATFYVAGETDKSCAFQYRIDTWNLKINELQKITP